MRVQIDLGHWVLLLAAVFQQVVILLVCRVRSSEEITMSEIRWKKRQALLLGSMLITVGVFHFIFTGATQILIGKLFVGGYLVIDLIRNIHFHNNTGARKCLILETSASVLWIIALVCLGLKS